MKVVNLNCQGQDQVMTTVVGMLYPVTMILIK